MPEATLFPPGPTKSGIGYGFLTHGALRDHRDRGTTRSGKGAPVVGSTGAVSVEARKSPARSSAVGTTLTFVCPCRVYFHSSQKKKKSLSREVLNLPGM